MTMDECTRRIESAVLAGINKPDQFHTKKVGSKAMREAFEGKAREYGLSRVKDDEGYFSKTTEAAWHFYAEQQKTIDEQQKRISDLIKSWSSELDALRQASSDSACCLECCIEELEQALRGGQ